ncbi:uncharacterized protein LOC144640035 [Oculina patagonica]
MKRQGHYHSQRRRKVVFQSSKASSTVVCYNKRIEQCPKIQEIACNLKWQLKKNRGSLTASLQMVASSPAWKSWKWISTGLESQTKEKKLNSAQSRTMFTSTPRPAGQNPVHVCI